MDEGRWVDIRTTLGIHACGVLQLCGEDAIQASECISANDTLSTTDLPRRS